MNNMDNATEVYGFIPEDEKSKTVEAPATREQVVSSFNTAFSIFENTPDDKLSAEERWAKNSIKSAKERSLGQGKTTYTNDQLKNYETGEMLRAQEEGIPVEELLKFLRNKINSLPENSPERHELFKLGQTLAQNSKSYYDEPGRLDPERKLARTRQEAQFIHDDARNKGTAEKDWQESEQTLSRRLELVIPDEKKTEEPDTTSKDNKADKPENQTEAEMKAGKILESYFGADWQPKLDQALLIGLRSANDTDRAKAGPNPGWIVTQAEVTAPDGILVKNHIIIHNEKELNDYHLRTEVGEALWNILENAAVTGKIPTKEDGTTLEGFTDLQKSGATNDQLVNLSKELLDRWNRAYTVKPTRYAGMNPDSPREYNNIPEWKSEGFSDAVAVEIKTRSGNPLTSEEQEIWNSLNNEAKGIIKASVDTFLPPVENTSATAATEQTIDNVGATENSSGTENSDQTGVTSREKIRREAYLINRTRAVEKRAREMAEEAIRTQERSGSWWNPVDIFKRMQIRVGADHYRQVYIERARKAMLENNNTFLEWDVITDAAIDVNTRRDRDLASGKDKVEQIRLQDSSGEQLYGHNITEATGEFQKLIIADVLKPLVTEIQNGTVIDDKELQKRLREFIAKNENNPSQVIKDQINDFFGRGQFHSERGNLAEYFATDILEIAQQAAEDIKAHKDSLDNIDQYINIKLATASWAGETEANFNRTDRLLSRLQRNQTTRWMANPAFVGAVTSLAAFGVFKLTGTAASTAAQFIVPGSGLLAGGLFAAARRNSELKIDRASHQTERAYNREIGPNSPRRDALEEFSYDMASVDQLLNGGGPDRLTGVDRQSFEALLNTDLTQEGNREAVINRIAEIKKRLDLSTSQRSDLITFSDEFNVENGRLELIKKIVEAKQKLRGAGMTNDEIEDKEKAPREQWEKLLIKNKEDQDKAFRCYRAKQALIAGAAGAGAGLLAGIVSQEVLAGISRIAPVSSEIPVIGSLFQKGETALEKGINMAGNVLGQPDIVTPYKELFGDVDIQNLINSPGDHLIHNDATNQDLNLVVREDLDVLAHADQATQPKYQAADSTFLGHDDKTINLQTTAHQDFAEPPMWLQQEGDKPASFIVSGGKDSLAPEVKDMYQGWEFKVTDEHNLRTYMQALTQEGIDQTPDVVLAHGSFLLNTHDIQQSNFLNPEGLPYDEWAERVGRINPATGLIEEGKMSITHPGSDIRLHGFLRADGSFDVGKDFFVSDQYPGNSKLTIEQWDTMLNNLKTEGWGVENTPTGYHIIPPEAYEATPPAVESAPIIPIPFIPRYPLEPMESKIDNVLPPDYSYYMSRPTAERLEQFKKNRSKTLTENPNTNLDPYTESKMYFEKQDPAYLQEVKNLEQQIGQPPSEHLKAIVCIPVAGHQEGGNIYQSLENYTYQDAPKDQYEILLFVNYPETDRQGNPIAPDNTMAEIERFQKDHPDMPIRVITKVMPTNQAKIGVIRKYLNDVALYRNYNRGQNAGDIILISNDADNKGLAPTYINNFIEKFDKDPKADAMLGQLDWDPEAYVKYPLVHIGTRLFQYLNAIGRHRSGRMVSSGANSAFKGSIYAAIGGYLTETGGEDIAIGQAIIAARGDHNRIKYAGNRTSRVYTSARRAIDSLQHGLAPIQQWERGFSVFDDEIRKMQLGTGENTNFDDPEQQAKLKEGLELIINKTLDTYESGEHIGKDAQFYKTALRYLGVHYRVENGQMVITDMKPLIDGLKHYQKIGVLLRDIKSGKGTRESLLELRQLQDEYYKDLDDTESNSRQRELQLDAQVQQQLEQFDNSNPLTFTDLPPVKYTLDNLRSSTNTQEEGNYILCLDKPLGSGQMGEIVAGYDKNSGQVFAFKRVKKSEQEFIAKANNYPDGLLDPEDLIKTEVNSPRLGVYTDKIDKDDSFIKISPMASTDLENYLATHPNLPEDQSLAITIQTLEALRELHKHGITYLDISPTNILLNKDGIQLIDLNAASIKNASNQYTRGFTGGFRWIKPPELFGENPRISQSTDTYEAAVLLYKLLTGEYPYKTSGGNDEDKTKQLYEQHTNGKFEIPENIPEPIKAILRKGIQPNPNDRYQSANEMIADLLAAYNNPATPKDSTPPSTNPTTTPNSNTTTTTTTVASKAPIATQVAEAASKGLVKVQKHITDLRQQIASLPATATAQKQQLERRLGGLIKQQASLTAQAAIPRSADTLPRPESSPAIDTLSAEIPSSEISVAAHSEKDTSHTENEDSFFVNQKEYMAGVFDGMGGMAEGNVASRTAKETIETELAQISPDATPQQIEQQIKTALKLANDKVREAAPGGGTTASIAKIWVGPNGERKVVIGNMGDSRIYLSKKDGTLTQLSEDDGVLRNAFLAGKISEQRYKDIQKLFDSIKSGINGYTSEIQMFWRARNQISRFLGMDHFSADTRIVDVEPDDMIILTSDGIHDNLTFEEVQQAIQQAKDPEETVKLLVQKSRDIFKHVLLPGETLNERRKGDDTTASVIRVPKLNVQSPPVTAQNNQANLGVNPTPTPIVSPVTAPTVQATLAATTPSPAINITVAPEVRQGDLLSQINQELTSNTTGIEHFETTPDQLNEYFTNLKIPKTTVNKLTSRIEGNQLLLTGDISRSVGFITGNAKFTARLENDPSGNLMVTIDTLDLNLPARSQRDKIEETIQNINSLLKEQINQRIDSNWQVLGFQIADNKLAINFDKK